ncbi:MAG: tyrosine-type recombinase/integrase [Chitinophagaceae bacterium]
MPETKQTIPYYTHLFLQYLQFEKRYSQHTITAYENDLAQFASFIKSAYSLTDATQIQSTHIRTWLAELVADALNNRSIHRKISTLKSFFKYLKKKGYLSTNPSSQIVTPKIAKRLPEFIQEKEIKNLINSFEPQENWQEYSADLIVQLFYATGIRLSELIFLTEEGIDSYYHQIKVLGKGNKERIIPVNQLLINQLQTYIQQKPVKLPEVKTVFVNNKGKPFNSRTVYTLVKARLSNIPNLSKRSPHILRHSFATHLMNNGADLNAVKELLGHTSLAATQVYTHNTIEKLKQVFQLAHPKA